MHEGFLCGCLILPSIPVVHKFLGWPGLLLYLIIVPAVLYFLPRLPLPERHAPALAAATFVLVGALFVAVYPLAQSGAYGRGSDADDAANLGARELLHGRYPYYAYTYLGNANHLLPGSLLLAVPFVLLGNSAYQNLFWLAMFYSVAWKSSDSRTALILLWLAFNPVVLHAVATGNEQLSNSLYVLFGLWWLATARKNIWPAVFLGMALASRANFLLLLPVIFGFLQQRAGWREAAKPLALTLLTLAALTLPFYLYDPAGFAPLEAADRVTRFSGILPYSGILLPSLAVLLAVILSLRPMDLRGLFLNCAWVQGFLVLSGSILSLILSRDPGYLSYGLFFMFFGLMGVRLRTHGPASGNRELTLGSLNTSVEKA